MRQLIGHVDVNLWSQISATIFCVCFAVIVLWVYLPSRRITYASAARLPLDTDTE